MVGFSIFNRSINMKNRAKKAFTLIELLVVILIVGILAAIAWPQYQKAVLQSKFNIMQTTLKDIHTAAETFYLLHNYYPSINQYDVWI